MDNVIKLLSEKYIVINNQYTSVEKDKKELDETIELLKNAFDNIDEFEEEDIIELRSMLKGEDVKKFDSIKKYFKGLKKFPNQSQVKKAKKLMASTSLQPRRYLYTTRI